MSILKILFKEYNEILDFYDSEFQIKYFKFLKKYLDDNSVIVNLHSLGIIPASDNDNITKIKFLLFLIKDSFYCLTQIIEALSSGKLSNFSHSFIGDIYHQIAKWATLYHLTSNILPKYHRHNKNDIKKFISHEIYTMWNRKVIFENIPDDLKGFEDSPEIKLFCDHLKEVFLKILKIPEDKKIKNRYFETDILNDIGTGNRHFLVPNHSIAMALRHYKKAIEVHSEGKEYKEMIKKMHIINDDISNGMYNFSLALERYTMNCGLIDEKMKRLREFYKESLSYPLENYLKDTSEF